MLRTVTVTHRVLEKGAFISVTVNHRVHMERDHSKVSLIDSQYRKNGLLGCDCKSRDAKEMGPLWGIVNSLLEERDCSEVSLSLTG